MKQHALLLSTIMVQAYLADRKFVTRRLPGPTNSLVDGRRVSGKRWKELQFDFTRYEVVNDSATGFNCFKIWSGKDKEFKTVSPVYRKGEGLWFRETWFNDADKGEMPVYVYKADQENYPRGSSSWRPSIHLPKDGCRLFATCGPIICEPLQAITQEQAIAEGIERPAPHRCPGWQNPLNNHRDCYICAYKQLWNQLNAEKGFGWDKNPPVYAINFTPDKK